jgi:hypothetical protein
LQGEDDERDDEKGDLTVNFLRAALMCKVGNLSRGEVFEQVQSLGKGPQTVVNLIMEFQNLAVYYDATFHQESEKWKACDDSLCHAIDVINDFDIKPFRPALLAIAVKFEPKEATASFVYLASLGVRMLIATSTRSGQVEQTFAEVALNVDKGDYTTAAEIKKHLAKLAPNDKQFKQAFQNATVTSGPYARYYLRTLERVAQKERDPWWVPNEDKEKMTLEHVLPLEPEGNWTQFSSEDVKAFAKRIGNMCLLPKGQNSDLKSSGQKEKFAVYKDAPYELTSQIAGVKVWNVEAIVARQEKLADLALKAWTI